MISIARIVSAFTVLALSNAALASNFEGDTYTAPERRITDITVRLRTRDVARAGGVLEVNLWQGEHLIATGHETAERAMAAGEDFLLSLDNVAPDRAFNFDEVVVAHIKLSEGKEVNVRWGGEVEIYAYDGNGSNVLTYHAKNVRLDTTGREMNRFSDKKIGLPVKPVQKK